MAPTFPYLVRDDLYAWQRDSQAMLDHIPVREKKLHWIGGTTRRRDDYTYFQREPGQMLDCFARLRA